MITRVYLISLKTFWVIHLVVGTEVLILRRFGMGGGGSSFDIRRYKRKNKL